MVPWPWPVGALAWPLAIARGHYLWPWPMATGLAREAGKKQAGSKLEAGGKQRIRIALAPPDIVDPVGPRLKGRFGDGGPKGVDGEGGCAAGWIKRLRKAAQDGHHPLNLLLAA